MKLTDDQQKAVELIAEWLNSNKRMFTLSGMAGTGKTFLLNFIITELLYKTKIMLSAPTHNAAVLMKLGTGIKAFTTASVLGLRPNVELETFDINQLEFSKLGQSKFANAEIHIIDEGSQIGIGAFKLLTKELIDNPRTKILFLGDIYQLPPVYKDGANQIRLSPVFNVDSKYELREVIRQKLGNPLMQKLLSLREDIDNNSFRTVKSFTKGSKLDDLKHGYIVADNTLFTQLIKHTFSSPEFFRDINHCRFVAYTNNNILIWNNYVRSILTTSTDLISEHDLLLGYNTIVDSNQNPIIVNGENYIISEINPYLTEYGIDVFTLKLIGLSDKNETRMLQIVNNRNNKSYTKFAEILRLLYNNCIGTIGIEKRNAFHKYYLFKNSMLLTQPLKLYDNKIVPKDIDYGYGTTVHKAQGMTFDNVFVNLPNIINNHLNNPVTNKVEINMRNRLLYVALSRASKKAIILI